MSVTLKGHIIDEHFSFNGGVLIESNNKVYSCILNQTEIDSNKNKFYIMQIVKNNSEWILFKRYGRLGDKGRIESIKFGTEAEALKAFENQFKSKTGNLWKSNDFVKKEGKYFLSEVSYEEELKNIPDDKKTVPDSTLDKKVQNLITMLTDVKMFQDAMVHLEIDTKKLPLGKLKQSQLDKAVNVLNEIQVLLEKKDNSEETKLQIINKSSEYYTYIPIVCGRRKPPIINNTDLINKYKETIDELSNMIITIQVQNNIKVGENPIDSVYKDLNTKISPLDSNTRIWKELQTYIKNTHGPTHEAKLEILDIFEIQQNDKKAKFDNYCKGIGNKTLLFHGTPQSCVLSIFKRDFYLDPSLIKDVKVQIAGKMFGYGVYFADMSTKSFNYTRANTTKDIGCFLVAEVALGNILEKTKADYYINKNSLLKSKYDSVKAKGKWEPTSHTKVDDLIIPNGPLKTNNFATDLRYNEFIVYDVNQIFIKYLIIVKK